MGPGSLFVKRNHGGGIYFVFCCILAWNCGTIRIEGFSGAGIWKFRLGGHYDPFHDNELPIVLTACTRLFATSGTPTVHLVSIQVDRTCSGSQGRGGSFLGKLVYSESSGGKLMKTFVISLIVIALVASAAMAEKPKEIRVEGPTYHGGGSAILQGGEDISTATIIGGLPYNDTGTTDGYLDDYDITGLDGPDVVYTFTPAVDTVLDVELCGSSYDTKLAILLDDTSEFAYNDDSCGLQSALSGVVLTAGVNYHIVVDGYNGATGDYTLFVDGGPVLPPQPGETCELAVEAVEELNSCQGAPFWYTFTAPIDGCIWIDSCIEDQINDTYVRVYSDCDGTLIDQNDDGGVCDFYSYASFLSVPVTAGDVLFIYFDDVYSNSVNPFEWNLFVTDCVVSTEEATWGGVKSLYR